MPGVKIGPGGKVVPDPATYPAGQTPGGPDGSQNVANAVGKALDKRLGPPGARSNRGMRSAGPRRGGGAAQAATPRVGRPRGGGKAGVKGVQRRGATPPMDDKSRPAVVGQPVNARDPRFAGGSNVAGGPRPPGVPGGGPPGMRPPGMPGGMPGGARPPGGPVGASAGGGASAIAQMVNAARTPMPGVPPAQGPGVRRPRAVGGPLGQRMPPPGLG